MKEKLVVRNSELGGVWGPEERDHPPFPFTAGQPFSIVILCEPNEFKVSSSREKSSTPNNSFVHTSKL